MPQIIPIKDLKNTSYGRNMTYNLIISDRADELIDSRVFYIINKLKNPRAAGNLLDGISEVYDRLEDYPSKVQE